VRGTQATLRKQARDRGRQIADVAWPPKKSSCVQEEFTMAVTRIVANLTAPDPLALAKFYQHVFKLDLPHDMGWIAFLDKNATQRIELHTASQGGSGTELPVISIGVDDLDAAEAAIRAAGVEVVYGPVAEEWGLRRFHFRDPAGNIVNVVDS
jgi:predicted enzyme related to lactoylglutathione lyase